MSIASPQQWHHTAHNAGRNSRRNEAERRHRQRVGSPAQSRKSYSGTNLRKNDDNVVPFVGGTLAVSDKAVQSTFLDTRTHYTHQTDATVTVSSKQTEDICDEYKTFGGPRSITGGWSARIRRRFFLTVKQYDLTPIEQSPYALAFIVLKFPKHVRTNRSVVATALERLLEAIRYKLGNKKAYPLVWNLEFGWDGLAHINLLLAFPESSYGWLAKKWKKIAGHASSADNLDALHVTRPAEFDDDGSLRDFDNQFYSFVAYMAGIGDLLSFVKAHQYNVPKDWVADGEGTGRMWGVRGMGRAKVSTYPIENVAQKLALEEYLRQFCQEKLVEYADARTGEVTVFNDGAFSETRRAGSLQCLMVTPEMHETILDILEQHASRP